MHKVSKLAGRLALLQTLGAQQVAELQSHFNPLSDFFTPDLFTADFFAAKPEDWRHWGLNETQVYALQQFDWRQLEADLAWAEQPNQAIIGWDDPAYPELLRQIAVAPPLLFVRGNLQLLSQAQLAMVGSRNPSSAGLAAAQQFAKHFATAGLVITSGLAMGIDGACHRGALAAQGRTIAVLGTGMDQVYPKRHYALAEEIAATGALVSEFRLTTPPRAENFPRRNRIISGLSLGVLVVEAALKSGSLITAKYALEQGRDVFALPGAIQNPLARGCHALIQQGAKLVVTAADVLQELTALAQVNLKFLDNQTAAL